MDTTPSYVCPTCNKQFSCKTLNAYTLEYEENVSDAIHSNGHPLHIGNAGTEAVNTGTITLDVNIPLPCGCKSEIPVRTFVKFVFSNTSQWEIDEILEFDQIVFVDPTTPITKIFNEYQYYIETEICRDLEWLESLEELGKIDIKVKECIGFYHCTNAPNTTTLLNRQRADDVFYDRGLTAPDAPRGVFFCAGVTLDGNLPKATVYPRASSATSQLSNRVTISCRNFNTYHIFYVGSVCKKNFMQHHVVLVNPTDTESISWMSKRFFEFQSGTKNSLFYFGHNGNARSIPFDKHVLNVFIVGDVNISEGTWDIVPNLMYKTN